MKKEKTNIFFLKVADTYCKITFNNPFLINYFKKEYFLLASPHKAKYGVDVAQSGDTISFRIKNVKKTHSIHIGSKIDFKYVDFVLMSCIGLQSIRDNIYFAHASSFEKNGNGFAFFGPAGAGKSTITKMVEKIHLYSDDTAIITVKTKCAFLNGSPFDKKHIVSDKKIPIPLSSLYILQKSKRNRDEDIPSIEKIKALIGGDVYVYLSSLCLMTNRQKEALFKLVTKIASNVKIQKLNFTKKFDPFWGQL